MTTEVQKLNQLLADKYVEDNKSGRKHATEVIKNMRQVENPLLLIGAIRHVMSNDVETGHRVGFLHEISERILHNY